MGVVPLSQILTIISYITAFYRRFDHCLVFLDRDRCLGCIVAVGHFVGQVCSLVFGNPADHICCHRCTGSDILECHAVSGNSTVCGCDALQCHAVRNVICQCNIPGSITGIRSGDLKFYSIPVHVVCFSIFYGFSNTELRPLRSRNLQFHAVSADGRVAGIVTVGLAGNSQAVGDLAVRGAVHLHGAAVQRQCHVQINRRHLGIFIPAVQRKGNVCLSVVYCYCRLCIIASRLNRSLHCVLDSSLCISQERHIFQRNGVLEFQGLHPLRAGLFGRIVGRCAQGIVYSSTLCDLLCFQRSAVFSLGSAPLHCSVCGDLIGHALSGAFLCQLDFHRSAVCSLSVLELRLKPDLFCFTVVDLECDITAAVRVDMQGIAVINCPVLKAVAGKVRQQQILVGNLNPVRIHLSFLDIVSADLCHQVKDLAGIGICNFLEVFVPELYACVRQDNRISRTTGSAGGCREHCRNAGEQHQNCQQYAQQLRPECSARCRNRVSIHLIQPPLCRNSGNPEVPL